MNLLLLVIGFNVGCATSTPVRGNALTKTVGQEQIRDAILEETNRVRQSMGLREVTHNETLERAAQTYANRMGRLQFFAHEDPKGGPRTPSDRVKRVGGKNPYIAENLATSSVFDIKSGEPILVREDGALVRTIDGPPVKKRDAKSFAKEVVRMWLNSPGHRKNLLHKDALELGCGVARYEADDISSLVAVQNFQLYESLK